MPPVRTFVPGGLKSGGANVSRPPPLNHFRRPAPKPSTTQPLLNEERHSGAKEIVSHFERLSAACRDENAPLPSYRKLGVITKSTDFSTDTAAPAKLIDKGTDDDMRERQNNGNITQRKHEHMKRRQSVQPLGVQKLMMDAASFHEESSTTSKPKTQVPLLDVSKTVPDDGAPICNDDDAFKERPPSSRRVLSARGASTTKDGPLFTNRYVKDVKTRLMEIREKKRREEEEARKQEVKYDDPKEMNEDDYTRMSTIQNVGVSEDGSNTRRSAFQSSFTAPSRSRASPGIETKHGRSGRLRRMSALPEAITKETIVTPKDDTDDAISILPGIHMDSTSPDEKAVDRSTAEHDKRQFLIHDEAVDLSRASRSVRMSRVSIDPGQLPPPGKFTPVEEDPQPTKDVVSALPLNSVVIGKMVDASQNDPPLNSPCSSMMTFEMSSSKVKSRFEIPIYVDEIPTQTSSFVVWQFRKMAKVKLSDREPFFTAKRGYYGQVEPDIMDSIQNEVFYPVNYVKYASKVSTRHPNEMNTSLIRINYYIKNDRRDVTTQHTYTLELDVEYNSKNQSVSLLKMTVRLEGSNKMISSREFRTRGKVHPKSLPSIMLTPQLFACVPLPNRSRFSLPISKRLNMRVWMALNQQTQDDWNRYHTLRCMFDREYRIRTKRN